MILQPVSTGHYDAPLNLLREAFDECQSETFLRRQLQTLSVVFNCNARLALMTAGGKVDFYPTATISECVLERVRYKLVDDETRGHRAVDWDDRSFRLHFDGYVAPLRIEIMMQTPPHDRKVEQQPQPSLTERFQCPVQPPKSTGT